MTFCVSVYPELIASLLMGLHVATLCQGDVCLWSTTAINTIRQVYSTLNGQRLITPHWRGEIELHCTTFYVNEGCQFAIDEN
jgi:hypothetical protein